MYDLGGGLPDAEFDPGSNLLISGPPLTGKRLLALETLAVGSRQGEGALIVTTKDSADTVLQEYGEVVGDRDGIAVGVVDCVTQQRGVERVDDARVKYASSPVDMTGIGIKLSEFIEEFYEGRGIRRNRILLHSISTLLMYSNLQTVFRFLHVFTGRVQSASALGLYVIDETAHDGQTMNTLKQLFDGVVTVDEDGEPTLRRSGVAADGD
ncbi:recombinase RecA [Halobacteriales archaeon QS_8_69_26]|nr:MAG: recombinase RecA [Halobacteriales archaeon QS_8_69_26]